MAIYLTCIILLLSTTFAAIGPAGTANSLLARHNAVARALGWFHNQQAADGSLGGMGAACEATWVVALAGDDPNSAAWRPTNTTLLGACEAQTPTYLARRDPGRVAKVLRAVVATGADPRHFGGMDLIATLEAAYDPATGFYHPFSLFRHTLAVLALHEAGRPLPPRVLTALLAQQHPDGGWSWVIDADPSDGFATTSDLDTTGRALQALRALGLPPSDLAYTRAVIFIRGRQHSDGGWGLEGASDSNSDSTALSIDGLLTAGWDPEAPPFLSGSSDPVSRLLSYQEASGAFIYKPGTEESRLLATFDAVPTLLNSYPGDIPKPLQLHLPFITY